MPEQSLPSTRIFSERLQCLLPVPRSIGQHYSGMCGGFLNSEIRKMQKTGHCMHCKRDALCSLSELKQEAGNVHLGWFQDFTTAHALVHE